MKIIKLPLDTISDVAYGTNQWIISFPDYQRTVLSFLEARDQPDDIKHKDLLLKFNNSKTEPTPADWLVEEREGFDTNLVTSWHTFLFEEFFGDGR